VNTGDTTAAQVGLQDTGQIVWSHLSLPFTKFICSWPLRIRTSMWAICACADVRENSQISNVISLFNVLYEIMLGANFWEYVPALVGDTRLLVQDGFNNFLEANRCDTAYSCGGRGAWRSICVTGLLQVCDMAVIHMCEVSPFICVKFRNSRCACVSVFYVTWRIHLCVYSDAFVCATWRIHVRDMAHSCVWNSPFICVNWRIHMCDMTHSRVKHV